MADQDIYATLIEQHRETSDLMQKLEKTEGITNFVCWVIIPEGGRYGTPQETQIPIF